MNQAKRGSNGGKLYELPWPWPMNDAAFKCLFGKHADLLQRFLENVQDLSSDECQGIKYKCKSALRSRRQDSVDEPASSRQDSRRALPEMRS